MSQVPKCQRLACEDPADMPHAPQAITCAYGCVCGGRGYVEHPDPNMSPIEVYCSCPAGDYGWRWETEAPE